MAGDYGVARPDILKRGKCWAIVRTRGTGQLAGADLDTCGSKAREGKITCARHAHQEKAAQALKASREHPTSRAKERSQ